jgi:drug/metabolite transporter (DMT)-like permease
MTSGRPPVPTRPLLVWVALVTVYLVWGSTYLGIRVVVETTPPLLGMGARFLAAGLLLATILLVRRGRRALAVTRRELRGAALVGLLLLMGGNGGVALAERTVPSGITALLVAATPLWLVVLRRAAGDRVRRMTLVGTGLGFVGIALLVLPSGDSSGDGTPVHVWGLLVVIAAAASWATGSFASSRVAMPADAFVATTWEMLAGGVGLMIAATAHGELRGFALSDVAGEAWAWLAYLVVFGSLVAFSAYVWLLQHAPISLTATYAYVNPVVAVGLGALVLDEPVTAAVMVGGAVVVAGVCLVVSSERLRRQPLPTTEPVGDSATVVDLRA